MSALQNRTPNARRSFGSDPGRSILYSPRMYRSILPTRGTRRWRTRLSLAQFAQVHLIPTSATRSESAWE
jgi:hypothetical protein